MAPSRSASRSAYRARMRLHALAMLLVLPGLLGCAMSAAPGAGDERSRLLSRIDAALAGRDRAELEALADWRGWSGATDPPDVARLELLLPPAPIRREKEMSEREVLYRDGEGRSWRLVLTRVESGDWKIVVRARPCPAGGMRRQPMNEDAAPPDRKAARTWTPLECWPLPK